MNDDYGMQVVNELYNLLQVDQNCGVRTERGFSRWVAGLRQQVWADEPFEDEGMTVVRVHARTDVLKGFLGPSHRRPLMGQTLRYATLSGFIHNPKDSTRIQLASSMYVNESSVDWISQFFAIVAHIQSVEAQTWSDSAEYYFDAEADLSEHPISGSINALGGESDVFAFVTGPISAAPSAFAGSELMGLLQGIQAPPTVLANGDEETLAAELPFDGGTSLCFLETRNSHPTLGNGLLGRLTVPDAPEDILEVALELNDRELEDLTRSHFLGSWCEGGNGRLCHISYFPNAVYVEGLLWNIYFSNVMRARWIAEDIYGDDWENGGFQRASARKQEFLQQFLDTDR
jgi:hypothetical protein